MKWEDITVQQFQEVHRLSNDTGLDDMDRITNTIGIMFNKSEKEIDEMSYYEFGQLSRQCSFLLINDVPGKPVNTIKIGTRKYAIPYKPSELKYRQYVEIVTWSKDIIPNLHYIMASLVQPVRFGIKRSNKAKDHSRIAEDMKEAKIIDIYHSCVFFCKLFMASIETTKDSLVNQMMKMGRNREEAETWLNASVTSMAGCIPPSRSQILKD